MAMELIVLEILPNMLESIPKGEDTDMAHFGIQVSVTGFLHPMRLFVNYNHCFCEFSLYKLSCYASMHQIIKCFTAFDVIIKRTGLDLSISSISV
jgi:hypothetical protein